MKNTIYLLCVVVLASFLGGCADRRGYPVSKEYEIGRQLKIQKREADLKWLEFQFRGTKKDNSRLGRNKYYDMGFKDAQEREKSKKEHILQQKVQRWAIQDAEDGQMEFYPIPGRYLYLYCEVYYEHERRIDRTERRRRNRENYKDGRRDYYEQR